MTVRELIYKSGLKISKNLEAKIGLQVYKNAKEKQVVYYKKPIIIMVNDYPDSFIEEMENIILNSIDKNNG